MELVRCSITENGETALHIGASAKGSKHVDEFVRNMVDIMNNDDLELQNKSNNTALYLAAAAGNLQAVKIMVKKNNHLPAIGGGTGGIMMPLYVATLFGKYDVVKYLYNKSRLLREDGWTTQNRGWQLQKCLELDMFDVALDIVQTYPEVRTGSILEILARKPEAFAQTQLNIISRTINYSKYIYSKMLATQPPSQNEIIESRYGSPDLLCRASEPFPEMKYNIMSRTIESVSQLIGLKDGEKQDYALQILRIIWGDIAKKSKHEIDKIIRGQPDAKQRYKTTSETYDETLKLQKLISERIVKMNVEIQEIIKHLPATENDDQALRLQNVISEHIAKMHVETHNVIKRPITTLSNPNVASSGDRRNTYSSRILFIAAEVGNTKFLIELIRKYPDLIWKLDDNMLSVFHIAVKHRREGIYNILYELGSVKDLITPLKDLKDNNLLHLAGKRAKQERLEDVSGFALQMQRELLWFKAVEAMVPYSHRTRKNKDGLTPYELFTEEHKDLVKQGEKWMKETASQCMVVATLIATIVFAAAFTVPGGYDQNDGIPIFGSKAIFLVFVVADAVSLFASSASILMFLSILTSRYAERDFLESLPRKLMLGLITLFLSIVTMTIAFSASFFVLYHKGLLWMPILIGALALLPVLLYIVPQYGLIFDVIRSANGSKYLFKQDVHVLYSKDTNA